MFESWHFAVAWLSHCAMKLSHYVIKLRWCNKNLYVKWAKNPATGVNVDSYGGCTVSVLKRGGWKNSFELATFIGFSKYHKFGPMMEF